MKVEVVVPQIGEAVAALKLTAWLKAVGDTIKKGDVLFEIDSDKAIVEVESFVEGVLAEILAPADSDVMPQQVVARIEAVKEPVTIPPTLAPDQNGSGHKISPLAQRLAESLDVHLDEVQGSGPGGRILAADVRHFARWVTSDRNPAQRVNASPKAKRLARENQIDLAGLQATHDDGMIRAREVEHAIVTQSPFTTSSSAAVQPLSKLQQAVALRTQSSKQTVPHFYLMVDVNMEQVNRLRDYCRNYPDWEKPPTYTDILLRACALALVDMPPINRSYSPSGFIPRESVHIGVAVDTAVGLVVPVIRDLNKRNLRETSLALRGTAERARKGTLKPDDLGEKSMVISNLGMYSVDAFIAIIDVPDPLILAVGRVADRVVPVNSVPAIQSMCTLTLSADHRALDGAAAARFLERLKDRLENPYELMG